MSWVVSPPTLNKQEDSEGCITGTDTVPSLLETHFFQKFNFEQSSHVSWMQLSIQLPLRERPPHSFPPTFFPRLHALAWSWLHGSLVKWKCEWTFFLPGGIICPPWVQPYCEKRDYLAASSVAHHQAKCHSSWCSSIHPLWFQIPIKTVNSNCLSSSHILE